MQVDLRPIDDAELELLWSSFKTRARAITAWFGIPAEDGEDLLQEAMLIFLRKRQQICSPEAWLAVTLRRRCLMYWRRRRRSLLRQVDSAVLELIAEEGPIAQETSDLLHDLERILQQLPDRCRSLLLLRYRQGLSPAEAARSLGYRTSGIYKILERCLTAFTRRLAGADSRQG